MQSTMDSTTKSKLPKPFKPRTVPPATASKPSTSRQPLFSRMNFKPAKLTRRSKSLSDLKSLQRNQRLFPPISSQNETQVKSHIQTSLAQSSVKPGIKRPAASKLESESKPKVVKQAKIPDWDYKGRFQQLLEKHTKLQEVHKKLKEQVSGIETLEEQHNSLMEEHRKLQEEYEKLDKICKSQSEELKSLRAVETQHKELIIKYDNITCEHQLLGKKYRETSEENVNLKLNVQNYAKKTQELETNFNKLKSDFIHSEIIRRKLHNNVQDLKGNIRVFCRVRPPTEFESDKPKCHIAYLDEATIEIRKNAKDNISSISGKVTDVKQEFTFDHVFNEQATQSEFFEELSQLVQSAIDGYHVCVFAYGPTGSGKTYTMQGGDIDNIEQRGMIPRTVHLIFESIERLAQMNWEYEVHVSFLEIYNENVKDLLEPNANCHLEIYYNEGKGTTVTNLRIEPIQNYNQFYALQERAQKNRMVAATDFNEHSSRSHAITKIYLSGINKDTNTAYTGSINLVDLAGSESAKTSSGERLVETKSINKSLSTLGTVMLALHNKDRHIPYRNSKLTYLLQSCLGGNSKTLMIVNIPVFEEAYAESLNSLRFASKVKEVKTKIKRNKTLMPLSSVNI